MKDLELVVYPRRGRETYVLPHPALCLGASAVDRLSQRKRFTDAELAAEYQFARLDSRVRLARTENYRGDKHLYDHFERGLEWEWTIERFATLPHYDEEQE